MIGLRTILFVVLFVLAALGALWLPLLGVLGYMAHYIIGPERQWWTVALRPYGFRYSFILALLTAVGVAVNHRRLRYGKRLLTGHEMLVLAFLLLVWLVRAASEPTTTYTIVDHPTVKLTKVVVFCLLLSHVVTDSRSLWIAVWTLIACTFLLGWQAYNTPLSAFNYGRLETVGGADFSEANFLPAFIGGVLPLMGIAFLRSGLVGKALVLLAGAFSVNTIVLTRSRGGFVGIAMGCLAAALMAPRRYRAKVVVGLLVAGLGAAYLMDPGFLARMSGMRTSAAEQDASSRARVEIWQASVRILKDHPFGVGPGNFLQTIGRYDPRYEGRDAHSTFVRCFVELGIPGLLLFAILIGSSLRIALRTIRLAGELPATHRNRLLYPAYGIAVGLCTMISCGLTVTVLYTEALWWFLVLPVCVERAVENLAGELKGAPAPALARDKARDKGAVRQRRAFGSGAPASKGSGG